MEQVEQIEISRDALGNTGSSASRCKKQSLQSSYWCLTWNNHTEHEVKIFLEIIAHEAEWYVMQEEKGEKDTIHIQGTLKWKKRKRLTECKKLNGFIHWEITKQIGPSIAYSSKEATRYGKQWVKGMNIPEPIKVIEPYGWQLQVLDIIKQEPDERTIHWFWEPVGNVGKTALTKYLYIKHNATPLCGSPKDIYHIMSKSKNRRIFVLDVPRCKADTVNYNLIESIKNGMVVSGKYESCVLAFNCPHVIVFANEEPNREQLSADRWNIVRILL